MYVYEQAFKESVRLILEIENQWLRIHDLIGHDLSPHHSAMVLKELVRLIEMLDRSDIKAKLLQELSNAQQRAVKVKSLGLLDEDSFNEFNYSCESVSKKLAVSSRVLSKALLEDPLLSSLFYKQETIYSSFYCDTWRWQPEEEKKLQISYWLDKLGTIHQAIRLIMWIIRASAQFKTVKIESGFYRDSMIGKDIVDVTLVRINCENANIHPTVSIAKHWVALTLYESAWQGGAYVSESQKTNIDVGVAICI